MDLRQTRKVPKRRDRDTPAEAGPAPVVVLVHGEYLGSWVWADVIAELDRHGVRSLCADLPAVSLHDDAQAVRDLLDGLGEVVLCGHSYGGAVISEAAAGPHRAVHHLVYLTAPADHLAYEDAAELLFHDCPPERASKAAVLLRPQSPAVSTHSAYGAAWRSLPFTYVRAAGDRLPEKLPDGFLDRAGEVVTLPTGHCPQWSRPDLVAALLTRIHHTISP